MATMLRNKMPLNALRAFESAARHLSFTGAGLELSVTQAAVSQHVRMLEDQLSTQLFKRLPRGLDLTEEGQALLPVLTEAFDRISDVLQQFEDGHFHEVLSVAVVGTFAVGWLMPRLALFHQTHPFIDLRISTHNNRVNLAADGTDMAIRFGDGQWSGSHNIKLLDAPMTVLCPPQIASQLQSPADLKTQRLMRSFRKDEWEQWLLVAQLEPWRIGGPVFDSSRLMVDSAMQCGGVVLVPPVMFERELREGALVRPFSEEVDLGSYWLTYLKSRPKTAALKAFELWIAQQCAATID